MSIIGYPITVISIFADAIVIHSLKIYIDSMIYLNGSQWHYTRAESSVPDAEKIWAR